MRLKTPNSETKILQCILVWRSTVSVNSTRPKIAKRHDYKFGRERETDQIDNAHITHTMMTSNES